MMADFPLGSTATKGEVLNTTGVRRIETLKHYEKGGIRNLLSYIPLQKNELYISLSFNPRIRMNYRLHHSSPIPITI
jgi:hypothetical protein